MKGLPAKFEAGLQADRQGMRAPVFNKTRRCKFHTSATGRLCWEGNAKVTHWPDSRTLAVFIFLHG
ncbi:Hypothetical protein SMAX5B_012309 [Scophthalmus maximus]|uniref:Uncharacterized protein n=1 Tax=Scophthalmus maximus TaxID=52904 RepID=A0A2U9BC03_SCOMX|nr:Hypothetical protein SMAX5B_012309 [Scophthalmus maximus]